MDLKGKLAIVTGVSKGIGIGRVYKYENHYDIPESKIDDVDKEIQRLKEAIDSSRVELNNLYEKAIITLGEDKAQLFQAHII